MRSLFTVLITLAACQPEPAITADLDTLAASLAPPTTRPLRTPPRFGGCADLAMFASNRRDTVGMHVSAPGLVQQASQTSSQTLTRDITLPSPDMTVSFDIGEDVTFNDCNDVFIQNRIDETWVVVAGEASMDVQVTGPPLPWVTPATATLILTELVVEETTTGRQRRLPDMILPDVYVGWLPG